MSEAKKMMEFSDILYSKLSYENVVKFILELEDASGFFERGYVYMDELLQSKEMKKLGIEEQLEILVILDIHKARYSDQVYVEALWYPNEIQKFVKENLPRKYSDRHVSDLETY